MLISTHTVSLDRVEVEADFLGLAFQVSRSHELRHQREGNREVEYSFWREGIEVFRLREDRECLISSLLVLVYTCLEKCLVLCVLHDTREDDLRKRGRADLEHLRDKDRVDVGAEALVFIGIVHLDPATASTGPGDFFRDSLHRNRGYVTDDIRESSDLRAVEDDILVDLVEYEETLILPRDTHDFDEVSSWMDDSCGVVRINDEDAGDILVVLHFSFEFFEVDTTIGLYAERVGDRLAIVVHRLGSRVRWVGRIGPDDTDMRREIGEDLIDRFSEPVKKYDILYRTDPAIRVVIEDEFSRFDVSLCRSIGIGLVLVTGGLHDILHPCRDTFTLRDRVTDILPDHFFDPAFFYIFPDLDDLSDLVLEVFFTLFYEVFSHGMIL